MKAALAVSILACALPALAQQSNPPSAPAPVSGNWIASWATSVQGPEQNQAGVAPAKLTDATIRQIVHLSAAGNGVRVQFSNAFGTEPLVIDAAAIATATASNTSAIAPGSSHPLTFSGQLSVTIPVGATYLADPVSLVVPAMGNLAISFHLPAAPSVGSAHPGSHATSYLLAGNHVGDPDLPAAEKIVRWLQIAEVDVTGSANRTVIALGDSITDGHGATTDGNDRWPDVLAARLQAAGMADVAVVNEGIGGNRLLNNGTGQNVLERFDRDVLGVAGARSIVLLEGINDLGTLSRTPDSKPAMHADLVQRLEAAYVQIIERAHSHGIRVYGATITGDTGSDYYHPTPADDADRLAINNWIRQPGHFDGFVDFDQVTRDPAHSSQLLPAFDSGDHLHPGPAGYKAMGNAIPLNWFR